MYIYIFIHVEMQVHGCAAKSQSLDLQVLSHEAVEAAKDGDVKVQISFSLVQK